MGDHKDTIQGCLLVQGYICRTPVTVTAELARDLPILSIQIRNEEYLGCLDYTGKYPMWCQQSHVSYATLMDTKFIPNWKRYFILFGSCILKTLLYLGCININVF